MNITPGGVMAAVSALAGFGWLVSLATVRVTRRKIISDAGVSDATAADLIKKSALDLANAMKADAAEARAEVRALRGEVHEAVEEGRVAIEELLRLRVAILEPNATLEGLRAMVRAGPHYIPRRAT